MEYIIENEYLKVTVTTWGAQVSSVIRKCDGVEHIWQADKAVWGFHGPILFPNCGKLVDGKLEAKGKVYEGSMHGFARDMEHDFVDQTGDTLVLELCSNAETLARFPYEFRLVSTFTLENDTLHHSLTVENLDSDRLPFGIGYHPGYTVPFDDQHVATDYEGSMHGFARDMEHDFVDQTGDTLVLELCSNAETLARFPYEFRLVSTFTLENDTLHHSLTVENLDSDRLPFGIGYHPGYTVPFDDQHVATDYELRFSELESPICIDHLPAGLNHGNYYRLGANIRSIPVDENLFANDSHCMVNLKSATLGLYEKGTGRAVVCNIAEFPYVLLWSKPGMPKFVCIEPWHSLPSAEGSSIKWEEKPAAAILNPGEAWSCTLSTSFVR